MRVLVNLRNGYAVLFDSQGWPVIEWHDKRYAVEIRRGECTTRRWADLITQVAIAGDYVERTENGWQTG